jgi:hypothetical protein
MTEATHLHDELMRTLLRLMPKTVYHDPRRLSTLAWAITGLCLKQSVHLSAWAEVTQSRAQTVASRIQRFSRWLHHPAISPPDWYRPLLQEALSDWPTDQRLYIALDTTALLPFVLIRASLVYRGRAIPLAWRAMRHRSTQVSFEAYQPVLDQVHALVPPDLVITRLSDRGFVHERLLHYLQEHQWHFRLRLPGKTLVHLGAQPVAAVRALCPPAGESRFFHEVSILGAAVGPVHLALACLLDQPDDPWFVVSDEQTSAQTLDEYGLRFDIEETFRDEKSGGFQLQHSRLTTPDALDRLLLCLALTTLYLTSLGIGVVQTEQWSKVDHHWGRGLSYLQLGARWRRQQAQRGWQAFAPFRLDPAPDPLPALIPRRASLDGSHERDLPIAA